MKAARWAGLAIFAAGFSVRGELPRPSPTPTHQGSSIALVGARVYRAPNLPPIPQGVVLIRGDTIAAVGDARTVQIPRDVARVVCNGLTVTAGFWNSHVHFTEPHWGGADTAAAERLNRQLGEMLTRYGYVHVLDTGSLLRNTLALRDRIRRGLLLGPDIRTTGLGFAAKGGSPYYILPARLPELSTLGGVREQIRAWVEQGADAIKLFTAAPATPSQVVAMPLDLVRAAVAQAHSMGRLVIAHPTNNAGMNAAIDGGVDILAHTSPDGGPWEGSMVARMKAAKIALIPTLKLWRFEVVRHGGDAAAVKRILEVAKGQLRAYANAGGDILFGTDVGYMTDYDPTEEYALMQAAGLDFPQILASLTTLPGARLGGGSGRRATGRLEPGAPADIVVLEGDPARNIRALAQVRYALRAGWLVYKRPLEKPSGG